MPLSEVSGGLLDSEFLRLASQSEGTENLKVCFCMHPSHKTSLFDHLSTGSLWITRFSHKYPLCQPFTGRHLTGYAVANLKPRKGIATYFLSTTFSLRCCRKPKAPQGDCNWPNQPRVQHVQPSRRKPKAPQGDCNLLDVPPTNSLSSMSQT